MSGRFWGADSSSLSQKFLSQATLGCYAEILGTTTPPARTYNRHWKKTVINTTSTFQPSQWLNVLVCCLEGFSGG